MKKMKQVLTLFLIVAFMFGMALPVLASDLTSSYDGMKSEIEVEDLTSSHGEPKSEPDDPTFSQVETKLETEDPTYSKLENMLEDQETADQQQPQLELPQRQPKGDPLKGKIYIQAKSAKGNPIVGAVFTIETGSNSVIETLTTGNDGIALSQLIDFGNYTVKEKTIPSPFIAQNYSKAVDLGANQIDLVVSYEEEIYKAKATVHKVDENDQPLQGVIIGVFQSDDTKIEEITTGADGKAETSKLVEGNYYFKELQALTGYELNTEKKAFSVVYNQPINPIKITNKKLPEIKGKLILNTKSDSGKELSDVVFSLYKDNIKVSELKTDSNGKVQIDDLALGSYELVETTTPKGYVKNSEKKQFTISDNEREKTIEITYVSIQGYIKVFKTDSNNKPISNVTINIYEASTNRLIGEFTTGNDGTATSSKLPYGDYYLQEKIPADGYELNTNKFPFSIVEHERIVEQKMTNNLIVGTLKIIVKSESDSSKLEGAVFDILNGQGQKIAEITTDKNGEATYSNLAKGDYSLKQTKAPAGYAFSETVIGFNISTQGQIVEKIITAKRGFATLELTKTGENGKKLEGVEFEIYKKGTSEKVNTIKTDSSGVANILLQIGEYELKETKTLDDYILPSENTVFELKEINQTLSLTIENKLKPVEYGTIKLIKVDGIDSSKKLSGAKFGLYKENSNDKILEITTGTDGTIINTQIPVGRYYLLELTAPQGYKLDETKHSITIEKERTSELTVKNKLIEAGKGTLQITKTDRENNLLEGAVFEVLDENNSRVAELKTNNQGFASIELEVGKYTVHETMSPTNYKLDSTKKELTITDGKTENLTFINIKKIDNLQIVKSAAGTGERLEGAVFGVYKDGTTDKLRELTTDQNGIASMELETGNYYLLELKAPVGYVPEKAKISFTINKEDEAVKVEVTNIRQGDLTPSEKSKPDGNVGGNVVIPKTGQSFPYITYLFSLICFGVAILSFIAIKKSRKPSSNYAI